MTKQKQVQEPTCERSFSTPITLRSLQSFIKEEPSRGYQGTSVEALRQYFIRVVDKDSIRGTEGEGYVLWGKISKKFQGKNRGDIVYLCRSMGDVGGSIHASLVGPAIGYKRDDLTIEAGLLLSPSGLSSDLLKVLSSEEIFLLCGNQGIVQIGCYYPLGKEDPEGLAQAFKRACPHSKGLERLSMKGVVIYGGVRKPSPVYKDLGIVMREDSLGGTIFRVDRRKEKELDTFRMNCGELSLESRVLVEGLEKVFLGDRDIIRIEDLCPSSLLCEEQSEEMEKYVQEKIEEARMGKEH